MGLPGRSEMTSVENLVNKTLSMPTAEQDMSMDRCAEIEKTNNR